MVCSWSIQWIYSFVSLMCSRNLNLISLYVNIHISSKHCATIRGRHEGFKPNKTLIAKEALKATEKTILALSNNVNKRDSKDSFETCRNTNNCFSNQNQNRDSQKGYGDNRVTKRAIMGLENQSAIRDSHMGFGEKNCRANVHLFFHMSSLAQPLLIQPGPSSFLS